MLKLLFITDRWCDGDPNLGITNVLHNLIYSCNNTNLFKITALFLDDLGPHYKHVDNALDTYLKKYFVDVIVISFMGTSPLNPTYQKLTQLKEQYSHIKWIFVWWDTVHQHVHKQIQETDEIANFHLIMDQQDILSNLSKKCIYLGVPQDSTLYYPDEHKFSVGFYGGKKGHGERIGYLRHVSIKHRDLLIRGGQRDEKLPYQQYARLVRQTAININFAEAYGKGYQCKGRVFEVLASNSLLLEQQNPITSKYFTPHTDYIPYTTPQDLAEKIGYYKKHKIEAKEISQNGHDKFMNLYTDQIYWSKVNELINATA